MGSVAEAINPTETCSGCLKPSAHLVQRGGDQLCETCWAVIRAAVVLLNRGIADEATIIPTLVFAKIAGGSPEYTAVAGESALHVDIPKLMHEASGRSTASAKDEYAGWELITILDGVPIAQVAPAAVKLEDHANTGVLKRVEIQVISRHVEPDTIREYYERAVRERGAEWSENNHGLISYSFQSGYLSMQVSCGDDLDPRTVRSLGEDFFRYPAFHFPSPRLVADIYSSLIGSVDKRNKHGFAYALDLYGKPLGKTPLRLILAFVAWQVGHGVDAERPRTLILDKRRVEKLLDRQVIESLNIQPENPWLSCRKAGEEAGELGLQRFVRLYAMGPARYLPKS